MSGTIYAGTSGFAYSEWKPEFYPAELKDAEMLSFYSRRFPSVEINNTFYRSPTEKLLRNWSEQTPETFRFTLKAPQRITHVARLRDADEPLSYFLAAAKVLDSRLGCILFQCPPSLRYEPEVLDAFLAALPVQPFRFAMEFRHASWDSPEVREKLSGNNVAWCVAENDGEQRELIRTARTHAYLRLRRLDYTDEMLAVWAERARALQEEGVDAYVYFKHEDDPSGVRFARRLREMLS